MTLPAGQSESHIRILADTVDDVEKMRIALANRIRFLEEDVDYLTGPLEGAEKIEGLAVKGLEKTMKEHPLFPWIQGRKGIGSKSFGRFLGTLTSAGGKTEDGEEIPPSGITYYYQALEDQPVEKVERTVSKLWAYCGFDPNRKKEKGKKAKWNHLAKMRLYVIADAAYQKRCTTCQEQGRELREAGIKGWAPPPAGCTCTEDGYFERASYDAARIAWQDRDTTDKHRHNHALRVTCKEFLKDLYNEAKTFET